MTDAANTLETRYIADRDEWQAWQQPSDKGNSRAQLRRIVDEWREQKQILSELSSINPDIHKALATLLQAHELMQRATITVQVAAVTQGEPTQPAPDSEETDNEFEIEFTEIEV